MKNVKKIAILGLASFGLLLLSACGQNVISGASYDFDVSLDPSPLGFWVDDQGKITVPGHILTFRSKAGHVGAVIEGYEIEYLDASGSALFPGDTISHSKGSLNFRVPPGFLCPIAEGVNSEVAEAECTINTPGVIIAQGEAVQTTATFMLSADIAYQIIDRYRVGGAVGARAEVTFYGTDDLQRPFVSRTYEWAISSPVGN